jgi:uncharacterized protein
LIKILFLFLVGIVLYLLLGKGRVARNARREAPPATSAATPSPEAMVSCAYCGLHIPASESLTVEGRHYCGEEHRRLDDGKSQG